MTSGSHSPDADTSPRIGASAGHVALMAVVAWMVAVAWAVLLRPAVHVRGDDLVLRQPFSNVAIPLVLVEAVTIRLFMVISTPGRVLHSSAFTRTRRELDRRDKGKVAADPAKHYTDMVEQQITQLAKDARDRQVPAGPITRTPAWLEIALVVVLTVAAGILIVV